MFRRAAHSCVLGFAVAWVSACRRPADQQGSVRMRVGFGLLLRFYFLDVYGFARVPDLDCAARVARIGAVG